MGNRGRNKKCSSKEFDEFIIQTHVQLAKTNSEHSQDNLNIPKMANTDNLLNVIPAYDVKREI